MECRKTAPHLKKASEMTTLSTTHKLTPAESGKIRAEIANYMRDQLSDAHQVVMGAKEWNPTQARVFGILLNKVVPDLNANFHQHEHTTKMITDLSRDELEAIVQGVSEIEVEGGSVIEHES